MNAGAIVAMLNAARRANTAAGWKSVRPFLAMDTNALVVLEGDDDTDAASPLDMANDTLGLTDELVFG